MKKDKFLDTHPFLTFQFNIQSIPFELWALLGEIKSKCEHIANAPLLPSTAQKLHQIYLAKGALATTAIEGNTLSEKEVIEILENRHHIPPSKDYLRQEIQNILDVCNQFLTANPAAEMSLEQLLDLNSKVLKNLPLDKDIEPGQLRHHNVVAGRYRAPDAQFMPELMDNFVTWLRDFPKAIKPDLEIHTAILKSLLAHIYFVWVHPFGDGNGRTARLIELSILLKAGIPAPASHLLSNFYNETRTQYYRELDLATNQRSPISFCLYAARGLRDGLMIQINEIQQQQQDVMFTHFIHETFKFTDGETAKRQRELALAFAEMKNPIILSQVQLLTPKLAQMYANKTPKTVSRDIGVLIGHRLIKVIGKEIFAARERVLELLPIRFDS